MKTKNTSKYKWIELAIVVWTLVFVCTLTVMADTKTSTFSCFEITASSSGKVEVSPTNTGWSIKAYGTNGSCGSTSTQTVTITIKNTGKNPDGSVRGVSFKITTTGMTTNDTAAAKNLDATTTELKYTATSGKGASSSATITISFADIVQAATGSSVTTTVIPKTGGTITVDGTAVTAQTDFNNTDDHVYTLTATPASGYKFYGWMTADGALTTDGVLTYSYPGQNAATLWPLFYKSDSAMYHIKDKKVYYAYLDEAITAAGSTGTIVVCQSGTTYHSTGGTSFTIPKGVTLLLPYSASDLTVKSGLVSKADYLANGNYAFYAGGGQQSTTTGRLYTLTIPTGTTLNVANGTAATVGNCGRIVVGGKVASGNGSTIRNGATYKDHSNLVVNGTLNLGDYAVLGTTGYVLGTGNIYAQGTGAQIYQPYVCMDFPGAGVAALAMRKAVDATNAQPSGEASVSPYIYWGVVNIQAKLTLKSGNFMYAYATLGDDGKPYHTNAVLVGNSATPGLLILDSGATFYNEFTTITWDGYTYGLLGRNLIRIEGGASLGSLQLSLDAGWTSVDIDTESVVCPIGYNMDITLDGKYDYYIDKSMMLLPGARLTVAEDATLTIGGKATSVIRFAVWDGLIHRGYRLSRSILDGKAAYQVAAAATRKEAVNYPTNVELDKGGLSEDANFVVNGKLVIDAKAAIGGVIQTDGNGTVEVKSGATTSVKVQSNIVDYGFFNSNHRYMASMSMFDSDAMLNLNGELKAITPGMTYLGTANNTLTDTSFTNMYYPGVDAEGILVAGTELPITYNSAENINGKWGCKVHPEDSCVTIPGSEPTCTQPGVSDGMQCTLCGEFPVLPEDLPANGHTYPAEGGPCVDCGMFEIYASSVQAGDSLKMYFYVQSVCVPDLNDGGEYQAVIVRYRGQNQSESVPLPSSEWEVFDESLYRFSYDGIAAKEMTDNLTVTIEKKIDGNWTAVTSQKTESIAGYAVRYLTKGLTNVSDGSKDAALRTTLVDLLNYGAACQTEFGYNTGNLANKDIRDYQKYATGDDVTPVEIEQGKLEYFAGMTVSVENSLIFNVYVNANSVGKTVEITYQDHYGNNHKLTKVITEADYNSEVGYHRVQVADLAIADGRQEITCKLMDADSTKVLETVTGSIQDYIASQWSSADTELRAVVRALMKFIDSAYTYFHYDDAKAT